MDRTPHEARRENVTPPPGVEGFTPALRANEPPTDGPHASENDGGFDTIAGWLSVYLPSWGTSVVLHATIVVLMLFLAYQPCQSEEPPVFTYTGVAVNDKKPKVERMQNTTTQAGPASTTDKKRPLMDTPDTSRGANLLSGNFFMTMDPLNPVPNAGDSDLRGRLNVLGKGGGLGKPGGTEGLGNNTNRGFMGIRNPPVRQEGRKIVYVVDRSGSMTDSIDYVKQELRRAIGELNETTQFHVIFYSSGPPVEMPGRKLVPATDFNQQRAFEFIDNIVAEHETDPSKALERAFAVGADLVYLLTDGEFDKEIVPLVKRLNPQGKVVVNTICFLYQDPDPQKGMAILKEIAAQNGGQYKFIGEKELAEIRN